MTVIRAEVLCETGPLIASIVTLYWPAGVDCAVVIVRMQVAIDPAWAILTLELLSEAVKLCDDGVAVSRTVPVNPRLWSDIVDVAVPPARSAGGEAWPAMTVKSEFTMTAIITLWTIVPLFPEMTTE